MNETIKVKADGLGLCFNTILFKIVHIKMPWQYLVICIQYMLILWTQAKVSSVVHTHVVRDMVYAQDIDHCHDEWL